MHVLNIQCGKYRGRRSPSFSTFLVVDYYRPSAAPSLSSNDIEWSEKQVGLDLQLLSEASLLEAGAACCASSRQWGQFSKTESARHACADAIRSFTYGKSTSWVNKNGALQLPACETYEWTIPSEDRGHRPGLRTGVWLRLGLMSEEKNHTGRRRTHLRGSSMGWASMG